MKGIFDSGPEIIKSSPSQNFGSGFVHADKNSVRNNQSINEHEAAVGVDELAADDTTSSCCRSLENQIASQLQRTYLFRARRSGDGFSIKWQNTEKMYLSEDEEKSPDWFSPQMDIKQQPALRVMMPSSSPSLFRLMLPWTYTGKQAWTHFLLILHTNAVSSLRLKRLCVLVNSSLAVCQLLTISAETAGYFATPARECYGATWCVSGVYIIDLIVSISLLAAQLLYWCFLYLPVLGHHDCRQPVKTLLTEVISSLDFWVLAFAIASLSKHGLAKSTSVALGAVLRHTLLCAAFLIIFVKYAARAQRDLQNHSADQDRPDESVWDDDDICLTDNRSVYWEHSSTNM